VKFDSWLHLKKNKYTKLFYALICLFFAGSFANNWLGMLVFSSCFLGASLAVLETLYLPRKGIYILRAIAVIAFVFSVINLPYFFPFSAYISTIGYLGYTLFMILAILVMQKRINSAKQVDQDLIRGGICIYLILGFLWSIFYLIIWQLDPTAFKGLAPGDANQKLFYFSFTTLTTLGYGDILPVNRLAMTLTNLEAIVGQLYPAIAIAKLVSLYTSADSAETAEAKEREE
jgi:hypothetical protein